jgi:GNAT superfamily N-acetyltransferase
MSPDNLYLRFFNMSRVAAEREARRICSEPAPGRAALLAVLDGQVIGCGSYEVTGDLQSAEVAMAVADDMHGRGIGTLLLEHLVLLARSRGVRTLVAQTLTENALMLQVFANAGLRAHRTLEDGVYDLRFPLPAGEGDADLGPYRDAVAERERSAGVASLAHVLAPGSVAVIGAGPGLGPVGRAILDNIVTGGFGGPVYAVGPGAAGLDGASCLALAAELPGQVDLAVIAVPAAAVPGAADACGRRGVKALVVTTSGLDGAGRPSCWASAAATACGWSGLPPSAWPTPPFPWTRHSRAAIPVGGGPGWPFSPPAAPASSCSSTCPGWASGSPPLFPSATRTTWPAPTCCCGGPRTRRPSWPRCTCTRSATRASSPAPPGPSAAGCRS